jgi:hypothetical protein
MICDHPDWWAVLMFDRFSSHLTVTSALQVFNHHKIMLVKEKGYTSAVNHPYNQHMPKADKRSICELIDLFCCALKKISQFD